MQTSVKSPLKSFCKHFITYVDMNSVSINIRDPVSCRAVGRTNPGALGSIRLPALRGVRRYVLCALGLCTGDVGLMHASEIEAQSPLLESPISLAKDISMELSMEFLAG